MSTFISLVFCSNKRVFFFFTTHPVNTDTFYGPLAVSLLTGLTLQPLEYMSVHNNAF